MNIVIAIDSFKGSLTSYEAGNAVKKSAEKVFPDSVINVCPIADGGEGTANAIISAVNGTLLKTAVHDPLNRPITAEYGIIPQSNTAVIEMASASGLTLISENERNPLYTTTYGAGEMIADAIEKDCRNFIIGIGGSATNDGGVGMLCALGFEFLDKDGKPIPFGAIGLKELAEIRTDKALPELKECRFSVACDVKNPLCGENGCSAIFAPQKGADPQSIELMDSLLLNYAKLTRIINPQADENAPGCGAAGGMGFALLSYLGATLCPGTELVINATGLEDMISKADLIITGEGRLDKQTCMGKAPAGIAKLAKKYGKKVIAFSGCIGEGANDCNEQGIDAFFPILRTPCNMEEATRKEIAEQNLTDTAEQVFRLIKTYV